MKSPRRAKRGPLGGIVLALLAATFAHADETANRYENHTDAQLTQVAGQWQSLDKEARRDFFLEMRRRMGEKGAAQPIPVRGERRFGQVIRRPDGSVVRIERIIRFKPRGAKDGPMPVEYGKGFEQRVTHGAAEESQPAAKTPPKRRDTTVRVTPAKDSGKSPRG